MVLLILLLFPPADSAHAPPPSPPAATLESSLVSQRQLEAWLSLWQRRLRLQEWQIEIRKVRQAELKPDTLGNLKWNRDKKTALIRVLDPADYDIPASQVPSDIELTVVHELIHLQLSVLPRDPTAKAMEEQVVQRLAGALLQLDRAERPERRAQLHSR